MNEQWYKLSLLVAGTILFCISVASACVIKNVNGKNTSNCPGFQAEVPPTCTESQKLFFGNIAENINGTDAEIEAVNYALDAGNAGIAVASNAEVLTTFPQEPKGWRTFSFASASAQDEWAFVTLAPLYGRVRVVLSIHATRHSQEHAFACHQKVVKFHVGTPRAGRSPRIGSFANGDF